jgi:hypothetical protein
VPSPRIAPASSPRHGVEKSQDEERVPARRRLDGGAELGVGLGGEQTPGECGDRRGRQRPRTDGGRGGIARELGEQLGVPALLRRPHPDENEEREALEPMRQVAEPAKRRVVGPVEVVDDENGGPLVGDVRGEPVEAVKHGKGRLGVATGGLDEAGGVEERLGQCGGPLQKLGALRLRGRREQRLEELAHDAEGEVALELAAASREDAHPVSDPLARLHEQPRLADAGRTLDHR